MYTSIITGDVVNSRKVDPQLWLPILKDVLQRFGQEPNQWEIFRGDSFQLELAPENALEAALLIKATMKQFSKLDVRTAIGIGEKTYITAKITESNGTAFLNSGDCFDGLKKEKLAIMSPWDNFNHEMNLYLHLISSLLMDKWTIASAHFIQIMLENNDLTQLDLASKLNKPQSNISIGLKRAGYDEVRKVLEMYRFKLENQ